MMAEVAMDIYMNGITDVSTSLFIVIRGPLCGIFHATAALDWRQINVTTSPPFRLFVQQLVQVNYNETSLAINERNTSSVKYTYIYYITGDRWTPSLPKHTQRTSDAENVSMLWRHHEPDTIVIWTHWGLNKMAGIQQITSSASHTYWIGSIDFDPNFIEIWPWGPSG